MHYDNSIETDNDHSQSYTVMTHSQTRLAQQDEEAKAKNNVQLLVTIAKRGTPLPTFPKDAVKNQVSNFPNVSSNEPKTSLSNPKSQIEHTTSPSLAKSFQVFDITDHARKTKIQMSKVEYLQANPGQFDRLVKFVKNKDTHPISSSTKNTLAIQEAKNLPNNLITIPSSVSRKIESFYISLLINGFKLSNCVIDSSASENVMPIKVANCLGLTLTKTFGSCYSMDNK